MVDLSGMNRRQRRRVEKAMEKHQPPSLQEWLADPTKLVKRGELWNVLDRYWRLKELEEEWHSPLARLQRFMRRLVPWMDDPPPNPFDPEYEDKLEEVLEG